MSNRKDRRAMTPQARQKAIDKNNKCMARNRATLEHILQFLEGSIANPAQYIRTTNRIYLLRCLGNILDSTITDVDDVMSLSDFDEPSKKIMKKVCGLLDELLDRLLKYSVKTYGTDNEGSTGFTEYEDLCNVSLSLKDLMEKYLIYFANPDDSWRRLELEKFMTRVIPPDALASREDRTRAELTAAYEGKIEMIKNALNQK